MDRCGDAGYHSVMRTLSVTQFIEVINESLIVAAPAGTFEVEGEVTGFRISGGKWVRFELKDAAALVGCFLSASQLKEQIADGMKIAVTGYPRVYPNYGSFTFVVHAIRLSGEGSLRRAFELLKNKLAAEGLFATDRKRALPKFPQNIAVVTSKDAAAYTDFIRVAAARWPLARIHLFHTVVQGSQAPDEIARAIYSAQESEPDVVVVTRGGGSLEELQAFNTEVVARAIFGSSIPVVSAIGHERDVTIADMVADVRAATPSNAAELVCPDARAVADRVLMMNERMERMVQQMVTLRRQHIATTFSHIEFAVRSVRERVLRVCDLVRAQDQRIMRDATQLRSRIVQMVAHLRALHPKAILARGFSYTTDEHGKIISRSAQLHIGESIKQVYSDGVAHTRVERI